MPATLHVKSGTLIAHRLLDVANEIDLARAQDLWLARAGGETRLWRRTIARSMATAIATSEAMAIGIMTIPPFQVSSQTVETRPASCGEGDATATNCARIDMA